MHNNLPNRCPELGDSNYKHCRYHDRKGDNEITLIYYPIPADSTLHTLLGGGDRVSSYLLICRDNCYENCHHPCECCPDT